MGKSVPSKDVSEDTRNIADQCANISVEADGAA